MEKVLEKANYGIYLNEIYLGNGSYGITAASLNYFNKSLASLDLHEMAMLAALPKSFYIIILIETQLKLKKKELGFKRLFDEKYINLELIHQWLNQKLVLSKSKKF